MSGPNKSKAKESDSPRCECACNQTFQIYETIKYVWHKCHNESELPSNASTSLHLCSSAPCLWRHSKMNVGLVESLFCRPTTPAQDRMVSGWFYTISFHPEIKLESRMMNRYGNCCAADKAPLQRVVKSAQKITNSSLPSLDNIYSLRHKRSQHTTCLTPSPPAKGCTALKPGLYSCVKCCT